MFTHHSRPTHTRRGFTLLEVLIASTIFVGMGGSFLLASQRGLSIFNDSGLRLEVRSRGQSALDKASRTMLGVTLANMRPSLTRPLGAPSVWSSDLVFTRTDSWTPTGPVLTPPLRLLIEYQTGETDDGFDQNGNGLIDEQQLVLVTDDGLASEVRTVICTGVAELLEGEFLNGVDDNGNGLIDESGFCVTREEELLILRMTTERAEGAAALLSHTEEIAVAIRNL